MYQYISDANAVASLLTSLVDAEEVETCVIASTGERVCGELALKPQQAGDTGLCSDFASGRNRDLQPSVVSFRFFHWVCHRPTHNGTADYCRNP